MHITFVHLWLCVKHACMFVEIINFFYIQHTYISVVILLMGVIMFQNSLLNLTIVSYASVYTYVPRYIILLSYILYNCIFYLLPLHISKDVV